MLNAYRPLIGPSPNTPEWDEARKNCIGASEAAAAIGVSEDRQPLDVYLVKRGEKEPFEGNDFTRRGHRFQPFLVREYEDRYGCALVTDLPLMLHPFFPFIGATPDAVHEADTELGVELKCCNWRRAKLLGEEGTDEIFIDWLVQAQQQMFVCGWRECEVFVMVDLHTYRRFVVRRNEALIAQMIFKISDLWRRIQQGNPPEIDPLHRTSESLLRELYGVDSGKTIDLDGKIESMWLKQREIADQIKELESQRKELKNQVLAAMEDAAVGRLPGGTHEITRSLVAESTFTVTRKAYIRLGERKARQ